MKKNLENLKNEMKEKILSNSFKGDNGKFKVFKIEVEEENTTAKNINEIVNDLEIVYNLENISFFNLKALKIENESFLGFEFYKIYYEMNLHFKNCESIRFDWIKCNFTLNVSKNEIRIF